MMKSKKEQNPADKIYTGAPEFAARLKVSIKTVFRNRHQIPHKMLGNQMVTSESVISDWLAGRLEWPPEGADKPTNSTKNKGGRPKKSQLARLRGLSEGGAK
ncbi:hypothetical protein [Halothiobacillus neapolitanus]|uniref:hypothetical protein n=1 Tax=Halothiobacillus neapolitanus TaxID=927 RepID=UPI0005A2E569|nr:hypothetical protein [Halothiobacillus neapolitanus]TDN66081.1 hypothetical protein C8D83_101402 [Halothiobacillus neapolitanus]